MSRWRRPVVLAAVCLLNACAVAPPPAADPGPVPPQWKTEAPWQAARPDDTQLRGDWWVLFGDTGLNQLEAQALANSPTLAASRARLAQASAQTRVIYADWSPQLALGAGAARQKTSADRPLSAYNATNVSTVQNNFTLGFAVNYELDLSGRVSSENRQAAASEQSVRADVENTRLLLTAELAADYANLRELDTEIAIVNDSVGAQQRALDFFTGRFSMGVATRYDVAQQQALLDSTTIQIALLQRQRQHFESAIAILCGEAAPVFSIAPASFSLQRPAIPVALPATVIERRPDVAAAERNMAAANAGIGLARSAYFPAVSLNLLPGLQSNTLSQLFNASSTLWSLGVSATALIVDGGRTSARVDLAQAGYQAAAANYRLTVLTAFQETQDGLSGLATLDDAAQKADKAVESARTVYDFARQRYLGGVANSLDVVTAQQNYLSNRRLQAQIKGQQAVTAIYLVKALGGGWQAPH